MALVPPPDLVTPALDRSDEDSSVTEVSGKRTKKTKKSHRHRRHDDSDDDDDGSLVVAGEDDLDSLRSAAETLHSDECPEGPDCPWKAEVYDTRTIILLQSCIRRWRCRKEFSKLVLLALHHPSQSAFRKRNEVWRELLTTERAYVTSLTFMEQFWYIPLMKNLDEANATHGLRKKKPILMKEQIDLLFSGVVPMRDFHKELLKKLESKVRQWPAWNKVGKLLAKRFPFLRLYIDYVRTFDEKTKFLIELSKSTKSLGKNWRAFEEKVMSSPSAGGLDLRAFLIMPIQRIPRYELLIRELIKLTPEEHVDRPYLERAASLVHDIAAQINERQSDPEVQAAMQALLDKTAGMKNDLRSGMTMRWGRPKTGRTAITGPMVLSKSNKDLLLSAKDDKKHLSISMDDDGTSAKISKSS